MTYLNPFVPGPWVKLSIQVELSVKINGKQLIGPGDCVKLSLVVKLVVVKIVSATVSSKRELHSVLGSINLHLCQLYGFPSLLSIQLL